MINRVVYYLPGALFANIYFLETMFRLIGDLVFFNVYADTQGFMKGFVYFVYAAFIAAGGSFMMCVDFHVFEIRNIRYDI